MARRRKRFLERQAAGVKAGQFVEWKASKGTAKGRVVSVHTNSKVPGVPAHLVGSLMSPAARVQLYAKVGDGWEPTTTYLGQPTSALSSVDELPEPSGPVSEAVVAGSFDDIRDTVQDALADRIEALAGIEAPVMVCDIGMTWVVYCVGQQGASGELWDVDWGDDLFLAEYSIGADGAVTLSDPSTVLKVTSYVPDVDPIDAATGDTMMEATDRVEGRLLAAVGVDEAGGNVFRVEIIRYGISKNSTRYTEPVMRPAARLYEGAKAYDHHRTDAEINTSTIQGLIGHYRNVEATTTGLEGDLHVLPGATHVTEALKQSLANQAQGLPQLVGISHDVLGAWRTVQVEGRSVREATLIKSVNSADVVADPSAGGAVMRMVAGGPGDSNTPTSKEIQVNYKQLLALFRATEAAKRPALLAEHAGLIQSFGYTPDEFAREIEAVPAAPPAAGGGVGLLERTAEATFVKTSLSSASIIDAAIRAAKGDIVRHREAIVTELPDRFTEAELVAVVDRFGRIAESVEVADRGPRVPHVDVTKDVRDKQVENFDLMLDPRRAGGYRSLKEAYADICDIRGRDLFSADFNKQVMRECTANPYDSDERATESITSSTFSTILGDSVTRRMIAEYQQPNLQTWRQVVSSIVPVNDFRTQRIEAMGGYGTLPTVNQGATYNPLTSPGNEEATAALAKRGGTEDLTLETIANDDLRLVQRIPVKLGLAAAQTLYRAVWDIFNTNPTLTRDSTALFAAGHANTTSTTLSSTALEVSRKKLRLQAAYGDTADILSLIPRFLVTVPDLEPLAWQLCTSAVAIPSGAPVGAAANQPNLHQGMTPIIIDYMSATSTTQWFVVADPSMAPTIEVGFYNGQEDPALFTQSDPTVGSQFTSDKLTFKIRHIYYTCAIDYRAVQRGNV